MLVTIVWSNFASHLQVLRAVFLTQQNATPQLFVRASEPVLILLDDLHALPADMPAMEPTPEAASFNLGSLLACSLGADWLTLALLIFFDGSVDDVNFNRLFH